MNAPCSEKSEEGIVYELFAIVGLEGANNKLELCLHKVAEGSNMSSCCGLLCGPHIPVQEAQQQIRAGARSLGKSFS